MFKEARETSLDTHTRTLRFVHGQLREKQNLKEVTSQFFFSLFGWSIFMIKKNSKIIVADLNLY